VRKWRSRNYKAGSFYLHCMWNSSFFSLLPMREYISVFFVSAADVYENGSNGAYRPTGWSANGSVLSATFQGGRVACHKLMRRTCPAGKPSGRCKRSPRIIPSPSSGRCRCYGNWTYTRRCARRQISSWGLSAVLSVNTVYSVAISNNDDE